MTTAVFCYTMQISYRKEESAMKIFRICVAVLLLSCLLTGCSIPGGVAPAATTDSTETTVAEKTEPPTEEATAPTEAEIVSYQVVRVDRSFCNSDGKVLIAQYYDYVELLSDTPAAKKINNALKAEIEEFFLPADELSQYANDPYGADGFINAKTSTVDYISDKYLCITVSFAWFMGGVYNAGSEGYVFNLTTGNVVTLREFAGEDAAAFEQKLKQMVWEQIESQEPWEDAYETLSAYTLDTFNFSVVDGQIVLHFQEYEFLCGAAGPVNVETGIYI